MTRSPTTPDAAATNSESPSLAQVVGRLSGRLDAASIGTGDLAELRRMRASDPPPAFWRLYLEAVPPDWRERDGRPHYRLDRAWAALIRAMAEMAPKPLDFHASLGTALARVGYSEPRFVRCSGQRVKTSPGSFGSPPSVSLVAEPRESTGSRRPTCCWAASSAVRPAAPSPTASPAISSASRRDRREPDLLPPRRKKQR